MRQTTKLTKKEVVHVAKLAGLTLSPQEIKRFQKQLSEILAYVSQLDELDTKKVESTNQVTGLENVFREDKPGPSLSQEEALSSTKEKHNNFFKVKAIFE